MEWSRTKTILSIIAALVGIAAGSISIAGKWGDIQEQGTSFFEWLYPVGVILALVVVVLVLAAALVWLFWNPRDYADEASKKHDRWIVHEVGRWVSRANVTWLSEHDFGGPWLGAQIHPFMYLVREVGFAEHQPFNADLSASFMRLLNATREFVNMEALNGFPARGEMGAEWRNVGWSVIEIDDLEEVPRGVWEERHTKLNEAADEVGIAYNGFITVAWRLHLLDTPDRAI